MSPVDSDNTSPADAKAPQHSDDQNAQAPSGSDEITAKYAAAQKEASEWRGRAEQRAEEINRLKKAIVGQDDALSPPEPKPATDQDLNAFKEELRWELKNESQIELADKNGKYSEYVTQGKSKQDALKLALFDEGITNSAARAESSRQAAASSPSAGIDRTGGSIAGVSDEVLSKYQRKFPQLDKDKLAKIIKNSLSKTSDPDRRPAW